MLIIRDFGFSYDGRRVLDNVSWELGEGEVGIISGPTGSGKTSLLYSITGFVDEYVNAKIHGDIKVFGMDPREALKRGLVYYVPQDPSVFFLGFDVLTELTWRAPDEDRLEEVIELFNLKSVLDKSVLNLSGGEAQKVAIASALLGGYKLIAFDEPLANLDSKSRRSFLSELRILKEKGITCVIAEHRTELLESYADSKLLLNETPYQLNLQSFGFARKKADGPLFKGIGMGFSYEGGPPVLNDVKIEVQPGQVISFVGPNGSGKSTLAKIIAGILRPRGRYQRRGSTSFMLQSPELQFLEETVYKEVSYETRRDDLISQSLEHFGLRERVHRLPHSLSRGERVRLALASSAAKDPDLYVLDEPTEGQDRAGIIAISDFIRQARESGSSVIVVTQEEWFARQVSDQAFVFEGGIVHEAAP
ncbi:MAG: ATP-binding cassette domain-containing protein [Nitrososphaeria archaeon]